MERTGLQCKAGENEHVEQELILAYCKKTVKKYKEVNTKKEET